jgi:hypothetical protein
MGNARGVSQRQRDWTNYRNAIVIQITECFTSFSLPSMPAVFLGLSLILGLGTVNSER